MEKLQQTINSMSDDELRESLKKREQYIKDKAIPIVKLNNEMSYRCVEHKEGYILQYKWWQDNEWNDSTDLSEMKVWEYNELVDKLNKVFPEYPIEHLEGRFV